jgi:hypothetical protein
MEYRIERGDHYLKAPKKWGLLRRTSPTRTGWDVIGAFETKQEALAALKQKREAELRSLAMMAVAVEE